MNIVDLEPSLFGKASLVWHGTCMIFRNHVAGRSSVASCLRVSIHLAAARWTNRSEKRKMSGTGNLVSNYAVIKLPTSQLRPTEEINIEDARMLTRVIAKEGCWTQPILVEHHHSVIMDGHHRHFCATALDLSFVPCVLLSYDDPNLEVTYWSDPAPVAVDRIIRAGLSGDLMRYKTTRHQLLVPLPSCSVDLNNLR